MSRLPLALSIPQSGIPLASSTADRNTPLAKLANEASENDYDAICVPLTNDLWRERWERLCLRPVDEEEEHEVSYHGKDNSATRQWLEKERKKRETEKEAEMWRSHGGFKRTELNITRLEEADTAIALASDWLELDSPDEGIRFDSELALRQELLTCLHLHVRTLVIPPPLPENREFLPSYARAIASLLELGGEASVTRIAIRIGVSDRPNLGLHNAGSHNSYSSHQPNNNNQTPHDDKKHKRKSSMGIGIRMSGSSALLSSVQQSGMNQVSNRQSMIVGTGDQNSFSWEVWDCVRNVCDYHPRLGLALDMSNPLPPSLTTLQRWIAEPTDIIFLPSQSFIPNAKGYPVLSKACQAFIRSFVRLSPYIVLSHVNGNKHPSGGAQAYIQYVRHLETIATTQPSPITAPQTAATGIMPHGHHYQQYMDYLQAPLQPLMDDLSSATYETFEADPVKYRLYEDAITAALTDRPEHATTVIYVVGAGRGPLVQRCLNALKRASRNARIYAIEKNANAFVTLQERSALEWGDKVKIMHGDMRTLAVPEPADIMVSELLGSFGDNESSPECLDGAVRYLKPEGISIPASYTAHLAPLSSNKLFSAVRMQSEKRNKTEEIAFETPYVVMFQQVNLLSGNPDPNAALAGSKAGPRIQECWSFEHPRRDMVTDDVGLPLTNSHNTRSAHLTFRIPHAGACHGLAGYFEAHLYGNIGLSIHPERMHLISPEMMSWFPLFFPFREPLYMPSGAELDVHIWRLTDPKSKRIWYEWHAESFLPITGTVNGMVTPGFNGMNGTPTGGGMHGSRVVSGASSNMSVPLHSPMMDAPGSPMPGSVFGIPSMHGRDESRIKIGQTRLHNTAGRSSWVGL